MRGSCSPEGHVAAGQKLDDSVKIQVKWYGCFKKRGNVYNMTKEMNGTWRLCCKLQCKKTGRYHPCARIYLLIAPQTICELYRLHVSTVDPKKCGTKKEKNGGLWTDDIERGEDYGSVL